MKIVSIPLMLAALLAGGCASNSKNPPIHQRGWIGGKYKWAKARQSADELLFGNEYPTIYSLPPAVEKFQRAGLLVTRAETNTPAFRAGLRPGDLILAFGGQPATDLSEFWNYVSSQRPGSSLPLKVYRDHQQMEINVEVGREKYRNQGTVGIGLPGLYEPHLVPTHEAPWWSLGVLGWDQDCDGPVALDSVEARYRKECHSNASQDGNREDWRAWLAIFWVTRGEHILAQEFAGNQPMEK